MSRVKRSAGHAAAKSRHRDAVGNVVIAGAGQEEDHAPGIVIGDGLLATEGPLWKTRHAMIQPLLRRGEMAALAPVVQRAAARRRGGAAAR